MKICPECSSIEVIKYGIIKKEFFFKSGRKMKKVQRYKCINNHIFTLDQITWSSSFIEYVVYIYLRCLSLNTTIDIIRTTYEEELLSKASILNFIEIVADKLPTLNDIDNVFHPRRSGYLAFDGTWFSFNEKEIVLLICFDPVTFDVIDVIWREEENEDGYSILVDNVLKKIPKEKILGIYGDGDLCFISTIKQKLPNIPFQLCIVHKELRMGQLVPVKRIHQKNKMDENVKVEIIEFQKLFRDVIYAETKEESFNALKILKEFTDKSNQERLKKSYRSLNRNFKYTLTHFDHPDMDRDNNLIECFNGCIKPRLKLMKGFKKESNIDRYIKLFFLEFRFRPVRESRFKKRRGQSPLECGDVLLPEMFNFLTYLRKEFNLNFS